QAALPLPKVRSPGGGALTRFVVRQPLATFGLVVLVLLLVLALVAPAVVPQDPFATSILDARQPPSTSHWFGTDNLGRDVFSRTVLATRFSMLLGLAATTVALVMSVVIGVGSGFLGGKVDTVTQRLVDAAMGIPFILFLLLVVTMAGATFLTIAAVIGLYQGITASRVVRGAALTVKEEVYVESARAVGASSWRLMVRYILPNVAAPIIIITSLNLGAAILAESGLSFLGYGVQPPDPTWGQMMGAEARPYVTRAPWMVIFPGAVLSLAVFSINVLGDGLRDALDPRLRGA
ncbi:MAG: ABC transporter permease, partial [Dehalococcoidia bacterium]